VPVFYPLLALAAASSALAPPKSAELAEAIAVFTGEPVAADDIRRVSCIPIEEEPTEAVCQWQQRNGGRWLHYSTYVAIDGRGWHLIDEPSPQ
jgi:hypothetical protein